MVSCLIPFDVDTLRPVNSVQPGGERLTVRYSALWLLQQEVVDIRSDMGVFMREKISRNYRPPAESNGNVQYRTIFLPPKNIPQFLKQPSISTISYMFHFGCSRDWYLNGRREEQCRRWNLGEVSVRYCYAWLGSKCSLLKPLLVEVVLLMFFKTLWRYRNRFRASNEIFVEKV